MDEAKKEEVEEKKLPEGKQEEKKENLPEGKQEKQEKKKRPAWLRFIVFPLAWILGILSFLLLLILCFGGTIAEIVLERVVPATTGLKITVDDISIYPIKGRMEIRNFILYNPENRGYASKFAASLGHVDAEIDVLSLMSDKKIIIRDITVRDVAINYETDLLMNSNLQDILDQLSGKKKDGAKPVKKTKQKAVSQPKKIHPKEQTAKAKKREPGLQLDKLDLDNVGLYVVSKGVAASGVGIPVTIPVIGPIGDESEYGVTPAELSVVIMNQVLQNIIKHVGTGLLSGASDASGSIIDGTGSGVDILKDAAGGLLNSLIK